MVVSFASLRAGWYIDYLKQNLHRGEGKSLLFGVVRDRLYGKSYCTVFAGKHWSVIKLVTSTSMTISPIITFADSKNIPDIPRNSQANPGTSYSLSYGLPMSLL